MAWMPRLCIRRELIRTNEVIADVIGLRCRHFRPPYGALNQRTQQVADGLGLLTVLWSVAPEDWECPGAAEISRRVVKSAQQGDIVLLHAGCGDVLDPSQRAWLSNIDPERSGTVAALPMIIDGLGRRGLRLANRDARLTS